MTHFIIPDEETLWRYSIGKYPTDEERLFAWHIFDHDGYKAGDVEYLCKFIAKKNRVADEERREDIEDLVELFTEDAKHNDLIVNAGKILGGAPNNGLHYPREFDLTELFQIIGLPRKQRNQREGETVELPEKTPIISYESLVYLVVKNLLKNVTSAQRPPKVKSTLDVKLRQNDHHTFCYKISIKDNAIGIPENALPQLFEPTAYADRYTSTISGCGFGLIKPALCYLQSFLEIDTERGKGSTFSLYLRNLPALKYKFPSNGVKE